MQQELGACCVLRRRRSRRFAVARDVKVDPLACSCATPSVSGPVARGVIDGQKRLQLASMHASKS